MAKEGPVRTTPPANLASVFRLAESKSAIVDAAFWRANLKRVISQGESGRGRAFDVAIDSLRNAINSRRALMLFDRGQDLACSVEGTRPACALTVARGYVSVQRRANDARARAVVVLDVKRCVEFRIVRNFDFNNELTFYLQFHRTIRSCSSKLLKNW
jgi:hypothetical protein